MADQGEIYKNQTNRTKPIYLIPPPLDKNGIKGIIKLLRTENILDV